MRPILILALGTFALSSIIPRCASHSNPNAGPPATVADDARAKASPGQGERPPGAQTALEEWWEVQGEWMPVHESQADSVVSRDGTATLNGHPVWLDLGGQTVDVPDGSGQMLSHWQLDAHALEWIVTEDPQSEHRSQVSRPLALKLSWDALRDPRVSAFLTGPAAKHVVGVDLSHAYLSFGEIELLKAVSNLPNLQRLDLRSTRIEDEGMALLAPLTGLLVLDLLGTSVTDEGLRHLEGMSQLRELTLGEPEEWSSEITDVSLARVGALPSLRELNIHLSEITDAGLVHLRGTTLAALRIYGGGDVMQYHCYHMPLSLGPDGLVHLQALPQLRELVLFDVEMTDAGLVHIGKLTQLRHLDLSRNQITDAGAAHLSGLTELRYLDLLANDITEAGLAALTGMGELRTLRAPASGFMDGDFPHLEVLRLDGTQATPSGPDRGLERIGKLTSLRRLMLRQPMRDEGLAHLAGLTGLTSLRLSAGGLSYAGLGPLRGMKALHTLRIDGVIAGDSADATALAGLGALTTLWMPLEDLRHVRTLTALRDFYPAHPVDAAGLAHLGGLHEVEVLMLADDVADQDLVHLRNLKALWRLDLEGSSITNAGLRHLQHLPSLSVLWLVDTDTDAAGWVPPKHIDVVWNEPYYAWSEPERRGYCGEGKLQSWDRWSSDVQELGDDYRRHQRVPDHTEFGHPRRPFPGRDGD